MFTGIIEELGEVVSIDDTKDLRTIRVRAPRTIKDMQPGSSIAVNGVCLTARTLTGDSFTAELVRETLNRSSLGNLTVNGVVNLERPMKADGRFDGHIVQGHVDGLGIIKDFVLEGDYRTLRVEFPESAARYIVEKGSITVDGISLTVAAITSTVFDIAIIPHTFENTNLKRARAGDSVNLEFDIIAKYVERMLKKDL
jgi:riboflavin synthase